MKNLENLCGRVYVKRGSIGEEVIICNNQRFSRFMKRFYLSCETEDLSPEEVSALCQERAKAPESIGNANAQVRGLFRSLIQNINPRKILEIGAGCNPILGEHDPILKHAKYVKSDADIESADDVTMFSRHDCGLDYPDGYFDLAAAVFVLHFNFYESQINELHRCLSADGVLIANVYRRSISSRKALSSRFEEKGFLIEALPDPISLCDLHEYWIIAKTQRALSTHRAELSTILERANLEQG